MSLFIVSKVSDGVIAPGYEPEALEMLKKKKAGKYTILQVGLRYRGLTFACIQI